MTMTHPAQPGEVDAGRDAGHVPAARRSRAGTRRPHAGGPPTGPVTMVQALNEALRASLDADPSVLLMGEDIGPLGGVFRVTDGLAKDFGEDRVIDTPLGEAGIVGAAVGLSMRGYRPVCEIQFDGFVFPAADQLITQVAKLRNRSRGKLAMPITVRIPFGGGIGAIEHHSESPEAYFAHTPGLKVVAPSNPADAYTMLRQAIASDDPVIFLEPKHRYWEKAEVDWSAPGLPLHQARVVRPGSDLTLVGYGPTVATCLSAADAVAPEGRSVEVIDLRSISPLDSDTVLESVRRTGRLVVVSEAHQSFGPASELAARVQEQAFFSLEAPVLRVAGYDTPYPASRIEEEWLPNIDRVLSAIDRSLGF
jgi:pyruvate dehydrogenase E1 component beta subunit